MRFNLSDDAHLLLNRRFSKASDDAHLLIGKALGTIYRRENTTESYVSIPPALIIMLSNNQCFTAGNEYVQRGSVFEWNVLCNDVDTGEMASRIEYRGGVVRIFGVDGWRSWGRSRRCFI